MSLRKADKIDLELLERGNSIECKQHPDAPFFRHLVEDGWWPHEGCWDCSAPNCGNHSHENEEQSQRWGDRIIPEHEELKRKKEDGEKQ